MTSYKHLDVDQIQITKPEKKEEDKYYQSSLYLKSGKDLIIQSPVVTINKDFIIFYMVKKAKFFTLLEEIQEKIIQLLYINSKNFFNGKTFTEKRIRESFKRTHEIDNDGKVTINTDISNNIKIYNSFKEEISLPEFPIDAVCIFKLGPLKFNKKDIILNYSITHIKLCITKKNIDECILDEEEKEEKENKNIEPEKDLDLDLDTIEKDFDDKEFFD